MSDETEPTHLKRGEAPRLLTRLRGAMAHDFTYRPSRPEAVAGLHAAMTVEEVRARYGLPAALSDAKIEAVVHWVVHGRSEGGGGHLVIVRTRDWKIMHVEAIRGTDSGDPKGEKHRAMFTEAALGRAQAAFAETLARRGRTLSPHRGREGADYLALTIEGYDPEVSGRGMLVARRGQLVAAWTADVTA